MKLADIPEPARSISAAFAEGLTRVLGAKLHGVYLYGAVVFPNPGPIREIDCHVILEAPPDETERAEIAALHAEAAQRFPAPGGEVDAYYLLRSEAQQAAPPIHQLNTAVRDEAWALHCAHVRAGCCVTLAGPEPVDIFPSPSPPAITAALGHELRFVEGHPQYPAYGVLNLCRILYSLQEGEVVVSKRFSGQWARGRYPQWAPLIQAAQRDYDEMATEADLQLLSAHAVDFLAFAREQMDALRPAD